VELPQVELPVTGPAVWERDLFVGFFVLPAAGLAVAGASIAFFAPVLTAVCWVLAALTGAMVRLRLRIDSVGVCLAPWGVRRGLLLPYGRLLGASAEEVEPWHRPGTTTRVLPGDSGLLLRRGPGMVLHLADGRRLAVPMRRPLVAAVAAGVVNAQLDRSRAGRPGVACTSYDRGAPPGR